MSNEKKTFLEFKKTDGTGCVLVDCCEIQQVHFGADEGGAKLMLCSGDVEVADSAECIKAALCKAKHTVICVHEAHKASAK